MTTAPLDPYELFDPEDFRVEGVAEPFDFGGFVGIPPDVVHEFGATQLAQVMAPGATVLPAGHPDNPRRSGFVVIYHYPDGRKGMIRLRDLAKIDMPDRVAGNEERKYQVTLRPLTKGGKTSDEWLTFQRREYDEYGYGWIDCTAYGSGDARPLDLAYWVAVDVHKMMDAWDAYAERICVRNPKDNQFLYHRRGAKFYAMDLRKMPKGTVLRSNFRVPVVPPEDRLW